MPQAKGAFYPDLDQMTGSFYREVTVTYGGLQPVGGFGGGTTVPTTVWRGLFPTYSLPEDHVGTAEYLTWTTLIPPDWDGKTDFKFSVWWAQADAETAADLMVWDLRVSFVGHNDTTAATYAEALGSFALNSDGTTQYLEHHDAFTVHYHGAQGTAEPGGPVAFQLYRRKKGQIGEALVIGCALGYYGTGIGYPVLGTMQSWVAAASRNAH